MAIGQLINRVGEVYRDLEIIEELGNNKVKCRCRVCNEVGEYTKSSLVHNRLVCSKCKDKRGPNYINRVGEVYRELKIIEDPGNMTVKCVCLHCGVIEEYSKSMLVLNKSICKNCRVGYKRRLDDVRGVYRDLEVLANHGTKVMCRCVKCGYEDMYVKREVLNSITLCRKCGIKKIVKDRVGEIFGDLVITKELGKGMVECKCKACGYVDNYNKGTLVSRGILCRKCGKRKRAYVERVGEIYKNLKITKELGNNQVECQCTDCLKVGVYRKSSVVQSTNVCRYCKIKVDSEVKEGLQVVAFAYTGRDGDKYYECIINGRKDYLSSEEIKKYT